MCATCGCGQPATHRHAHGTTHDHGHGHGHEHGHRHAQEHELGHEHATQTHRRPHSPNGAEHRLEPGPQGGGNFIQIEQALLAENDRYAAHNRGVFNRRHTRAFNFISSPGAGKTTLLEKTLTALRARRVGCAVVEGDQATDLDAQRIARTGVPVFQIETGRSCHLDAQQIEHALGHLDVPERGLFFIENVGNLICPTEFNLGEHERVTIVSVAEGHDKPAKYPLAFRNATAIVISKMDLLPHVDFDIVEARRLIAGLNPKAPVFELSARTGDGMNDWLSWLQHKIPNES
jgi:hydrogenase nickel incorporation protein HypB